jgi:PAS domain S-box-containing protein
MNLKQKTNHNLGNRKSKGISIRSHVNKPLSSEQATRQIEEEIRTLNKQIEFILGATKTGLDIIDSEFNVRYIDSEWAKVYGDPTGRKCYEYFMGRKDPCPGCGIIVALRTKKPVVTEEVLVKENNRPIQVTTIPFQNAKGEWLVAEVNVDLTQHKRAEGALREAYNTSENRVRERTEELARTNETLQADIVEREQTEEALRRSEEEAKRLAQESAIMAKIGQIISSTLNIQEVYERFAEEAHYLISFDRIAINTINPDDSTFTVSYVAGLEIAGRHQGDIIPLKGSLTGEILRTRSSLLIQGEEIRETVNRLPGLLPTIQSGFRSMMGIPLTAKNQVIGALHFRSTKPNAYTEIDLRLAERVGTQIAGAIANAQLFMERKQTEEKYRTIVSTTMDSFWIVDMQGRFLDVNDAYCRVIGYSRDELLTMSISDIEAEERTEETARRIQKIMEVGGDRFETRHKCKDGRIIDIEVGVNYMEIGGGRMFVFLHDITERKRAEEALRESEERYRTILENIEDGYYEVDLPGNFTFFNDSLCRMLGYSKDEMIGMGNQQYTDQENRKKLFQAFNEVYRKGEPTKRFDWEVIRKDGTKVFGEVSVSLIKDSKGQPTGFRGIARDITERKRAEDELQIQKQSFQTLSEGAPFGMIMIDQEGHFKYINPKFIELFGYNLKDVPSGKEWFRKAYPDPTYRHHVISTWIKDLESYKPGEKRSRTFAVTCKDGMEKIINFIPVQLETGENLMTCEDITESKRTEEALRKSQHLLESTYISLRDAVFIIDAKTVEIIECNPAASEIFGYTRNELLDRATTFLHVTEASLEEFRKNLYAAVETKGFLSQLEFKMKRKDGTVFPTENAVVPLKDEQDKLMGWVSVVRDITDRKRAEEALRESEERYRTILENIEDGYYETDLPGNLTFFNDSLCRTLGYSKDEMIGMSNKQYTDEENRKKLFAAFNEVYRTGEPTKGFDWQVFTKDGAKLFGEVSVSLIKDSKGQPTGFRGIARDITERKRAEEALRTEKQRFEILLENAPFGVIMIDKEGNFKYVNSKFIELFGYDFNDIPNGREWFRKAYPDPEYRHDVIETWINDSNISEPEEKIPRIFTVTCKDRTKKIIRFITVQLEGGEYLMSSEDITLIQRAEEEKAALAEQLRQSQKMEAIGRLAGGIAHDFNNLLTVIRGYSQLSLLELKADDKLRENIEEVQRATQRATDLTRQLLAFGRRQIMEMKILDLNALLKDLDKMLRRVIGEDIELTYLLANDIGKVKIDPGQIEQVILNLAVNARDAMPSGGKLTIETSNAELDEAYAHTHIGSKPGRYVMLSVSDTGVGMTPEIRERAFDPFFTTKEKGKGTGLGLSTCYGIVKQSGGNIWAYSEPGRGTTFKIYLPWLEEFPKETKDKPEAAEIHKGTETILAVEDEIEVRKLVAQILKGQGYTVIEASDGEEAIKVAQKNSGNKIHLLLTDVVMPGMSGRQLAVTLGLQHPNMKILYMSGYTDNAIVHHGVLEEGVNYIQKPFTLDALARKVREVLDQRG